MLDPLTISPVMAPAPTASTVTISSCMRVDRPGRERGRSFGGPAEPTAAVRFLSGTEPTEFGSFLKALSHNGCLSSKDGPHSVVAKRIVWRGRPALRKTGQKTDCALETGLSLRPRIQRQCDDMDWNELRDVCLTFPGSEETFPFGFETSVFKVAGKMFALSRASAEPLQISLKCEPALAEQLRAAHSAIAPGYHLNKRHWNTVTLDGSLRDSMIAELIEDSYDLVVSGLPKTRQRALRWRPDPT